MHSGWHMEAAKELILREKFVQKQKTLPSLNKTRADHELLMAYLY